MEWWEKIVASLGGLSITVILLYFYLGQSILDFIANMGFFDVPLWWYGMFALGFIFVFIALIIKEQWGERKTPLRAKTTFGILALPQLFSDVLWILWDKLPWFIALVIALLFYELIKRTGKAGARKLGEKAQSKWTAFIILILLTFLFIILWQRGYFAV